MSDLDWQRDMFNKMVGKHKESRVLNDYFDGACLFRVFGWQRDVEKWYDVFAKDKEEAKQIAGDTIEDFEVDQVIKAPGEEQEDV